MNWYIIYTIQDKHSKGICWRNSSTVRSFIVIPLCPRARLYLHLFPNTSITAWILRRSRNLQPVLRSLKARKLILSITSKNSMNRSFFALGINHSVTHAELFLTPEGEVVFGEIGARIGGSHVMPPCIKNTHGVDFFEAVTDLEVGIYEFKQQETSHKFTGMICFPSRAGVIQHISGIEDYADIPGIVSSMYPIKWGGAPGTSTIP